MKKVTDLTKVHDESKNVDGGIVYRKDTTIQARWNNGAVETWYGKNQSVSDVKIEFATMCKRWSK